MKKFWEQIAQYLYLKKKNPDETVNTNTKLMHGMNRISLLLFLMALLIIILRAILRH
ncbi:MULTISPECIES: DUF6728 family protein [Chitinophagaceae]